MFFTVFSFSEPILVGLFVAESVENGLFYQKIKKSVKKWGKVVENVKLIFMFAK